MQTLPALLQKPDTPKKYSHMDIVPAGMHDPRILRLPGKTCLFRHRQSIHIRAEGNGMPGPPAFDDCVYSCICTGPALYLPFFQLSENPFLCFIFLSRYFRMSVEMDVIAFYLCFCLPDLLVKINFHSEHLPEASAYSPDFFLIRFERLSTVMLCPKNRPSAYSVFASLPYSLARLIA